MTIMKHFTLSYTPISPIHIGTGDNYDPTNYFIDEGALYEFDTGGALAAFKESDREELYKTVNGKPNAEMLNSVQKFFYDRREVLKPWAINEIPVLDGVARLYADRIGKPAQRENGGSQVINKLEIDRTAYNPLTRQPVLFGSSIKGAVRTAILSHENKQRPLSRRDADLFKVENLSQPDRKQKEREQKSVFPKLNHELFKFSAGKFELDPMRLVQFGDAAWSSQDELPFSQILVTVNRKKALNRDKNGNEIYSQAEKNENLCKLLECIPAWRYRAFSGQLNLQNVAKIKHSDRLPNADLLFSMEEIAHMCSDFYLPILQAEMEVMRARGFLDQHWHSNIEALLDSMADKFARRQVFLLRVGRHSGAESMTIDGVRHIKIMKGNPEYQPQAKTLWLAASDPKQRKDLLPFGWLLAEIHPGQTMHESQDLAELCANQQGLAKIWAKKQAEKRTQLAAKRAAAEIQRREEKILRQQHLEQEQIAEQERIAIQQAEQARIASLTPEQLQIEALRRQLELKQISNVREQIGGPLYGDLRNLIQKAAGWPADAKRELLAVAQEVLQYIGASGNKKAKELLKTLHPG
ncbi:MAG: RAMP superfamily CRISPR-associated protein [Methylomonas sp.]|jgi:CRISPR-associated protein Csm5